MIDRFFCPLLFVLASTVSTTSACSGVINGECNVQSVKGLGGTCATLADEVIDKACSLAGM